MPQLASNYTAIAPDMRDSGNSEKPDGDMGIWGYDKRAMPRDISDADGPIF
nr:hypothetical protein [uncultured Cohaesibacter sp.]